MRHPWLGIAIFALLAVAPIGIWIEAGPTTAIFSLAVVLLVSGSAIELTRLRRRIDTIQGQLDIANVAAEQIYRSSKSAQETEIARRIAAKLPGGQA